MPSLQSVFSWIAVCCICFNAYGIAVEQQLSLEAHGIEFDRKNTWRETTLLYNVVKRNHDSDSALLGSFGARHDMLKLHNHMHPSGYNALLAQVGTEKRYDRWLWLSTFEGSFQAPTFSPLNSTRYTFETVASYQFTNRLSAQFGAGVKFGLHVPCGYPILGLLYLADRWKFTLLIPNLASACYQLNERNTIGLSFLHKPRVFRTEHAFGYERAIVNFQTVFAEARWTHAFSKKTSFWVALGWNLYTRIQAGNKVYDHAQTVFHSSRGLAATLGIKRDL